MMNHQYESKGSVNTLPVKNERRGNGLPNQLKAGIESLSGLSMDDVSVHYNSSKPVQLQALAYTQGTSIHLGPGQEKHLAHEAWHVVQQKQGRVQPTMQIGGTQINDSRSLESEADTMGIKALQFKAVSNTHSGQSSSTDSEVRPKAVRKTIQLMKIPNYPDQNWMIARIRGLEGLLNLSTGFPEHLYEEIDLLEKQAAEKGWTEALHKLKMLTLKLDPVEELPEWVSSVSDGALRDFFKITKRDPRMALETPNPSTEFDLLQLTNFHRVIQQLLGDVNEESGTSYLNIRSGTDLLYSVGRLSMMINPSDYFPSDETRPLPLNWTSPKFLKMRPDNDVGTIVKNLEQASGELLFPERQRQQIAFNSQYGRSILPDPEFLHRILNYLDPASLMNLALTNRAMFTTLAYGLPSTSFGTRDQQKMISGLSAIGPELFGKGRRKIDKDANHGEFFSAMMNITSTKKWSNLISNSILPRTGKEINLKGDEYGMTLPWGTGQGVPLVNMGSVRLTFTEAERIMKVIGDDSDAIDLSYERIVSYLQTMNSRDSALALRDTLGDLRKAPEPFFGELAILLGGIEASQNNMAVMQAPMIADLVADGVIDWDDALFRRKAVPYYVMAADKSEKGKYPMLRHSNVLKSRRIEDDDQGDYDKFESFIGQEFNLNKLFLETYFPQLKLLDLHDQLLFSSLLMKRYLKDVYQ